MMLLSLTALLALDVNTKIFWRSVTCKTAVQLSPSYDLDLRKLFGSVDPSCKVYFDALFDRHVPYVRHLPVLYLLFRSPFSVG